MGRNRPTRDPLNLSGTRQVTWRWSDPTALLAAPSDGAVVFEAPEVSRLSAPRPRRAARNAGRHALEVRSLGLPLGVVELEGRLTCWSCARNLHVQELTGDGVEPPSCPGCGARLPVR